MFPKIEDEEEFVNRIVSVNNVYQLAHSGSDTIDVFSIDEKTGIQAIQNTKTTKADINKKKRLDHEYIRNGTVCLTAAFSVNKGSVPYSVVDYTRKADDFRDFIKTIVDSELDSKKSVIFVADQLNTHKSEELVRYLAEINNYTEELGVKGKCGILKSMKTRMEFLENNNHRVRFQFTPKHCSWMNQIENWFGSLERRLLKHGQFTSTDELKNSILRYIEYHNYYYSKPINWKFTGEKYIQKLQK